MGIKGLTVGMDACRGRFIMAYTGKAVRENGGYKLAICSHGIMVWTQYYRCGYIQTEDRLKELLKEIILHYKAMEGTGPIDAYAGTEYSELDLGI